MTTEAKVAEGAVLDRLKTMEQTLLSIEAQCIREKQITWPLVAVMHELDNAIAEYTAKAYRGTATTKPKGVYL